MHDVADFKFADGDEEAGPREARKWLESLGVNNKIIEQIEEIIRTISFRGAKVKMNLESIEAKIVYDADKLDSIGAIGIARVFAFGGTMKRPIYDPATSAVMHDSFEAYKKGSGTSINHFYEKLLLLKDRMQTKMGREMAEQRHEYMEQFLEQFYAEWEGER